MVHEKATIGKYKGKRKRNFRKDETCACSSVIIWVFGKHPFQGLEFGYNEGKTVGGLYKSLLIVLELGSKNIHRLKTRHNILSKQFKLLNDKIIFTD